MEITFLGTGGSIPSKNRGMPSIAVKALELMLFDCGEGTQRQMMRYGVKYGSVKSIFISHLHLDHYLGLYGYLETLGMCLPERKLDVFVPKGFQKLRHEHSPNIIYNTINSRKLYENKEFEVYAFPTTHMKDSYGFLIQEKDRIKFYGSKAKSLGIKGPLFTKIMEKKKLKIKGKTIHLKDISWIKKGRKVVYTSDTMPNDKIINISKNADALIHDATFTEEYKGEAEERKHTTALQAAKIAKKAKVRTLVLTHISPRYRDPNEILNEAKKVFPNTLLAEDGLKLKL